MSHPRRPPPGAWGRESFLMEKGSRRLWRLSDASGREDDVEPRGSRRSMPVPFDSARASFSCSLLRLWGLVTCWS